MTKTKLIKELKLCGDNVPVQVALELRTGEMLFYDIEFVSPSDEKELPSLINITEV
jgi:hypothetical protein